MALYRPVLSYGVVNYGDPIYLQNHWVQRGLTLAGVRWAFTSVTYFYSPATWVSLMADDQIYGDDPAGFHLTNVLLHAVNVVALLLLLWRLTRDLRVSTPVAALFAVHPLNVEAVAWIAERKGLLGALFCLLCLHAYLSYCKRPGVARYALFNALFVLSLLAKPMALTLPLVLLILDVVVLRRGASDGTPGPAFDGVSVRRLGSLLLEKAPVLVAVLVMVGLTFKAETKVGALSLNPSQAFGYRIEKVINGYWQYVANGFWPTRLSVLYPLPASFPVWRTAGSVLFFAVLATIIVLKRDRWCLFGLAWYLILLIPVSGLVQLGVQYAPDRYAYLPLVGLFLIAARVVTGWRWRWATATGCFLVLGLLAYQASRQIKVWRNTLSLFSHAIQVTKGNFVALNNVAWILATDPRYDRSPAEQHRALRYAQEACRLTKFQDDRLLETLGVCLVRVGNRVQARDEFLQAALVAERHGRPKWAARYLKEANKYGPASAVQPGSRRAPQANRAKKGL